MSIGQPVRSVVTSFGRSFVFGPSLLCLILGGTVFVSGGCDGGNTSGKNEVVPVDEAKAKENQKMIENMYKDKKPGPAAKK